MLRYDGTPAPHHQRGLRSFRGGRSALLAAAILSATLVLVPSMAGATPTWVVLTPTPNPGTSLDALTGVSCKSTTWCMAVGYRANSEVTAPLIEWLEGTTWSAVLASPENGVASNSLNKVSCVTMDFCAAVGSSEVGDEFQTLAETWNGTTWSIDPQTALGGLRSVACTSSTFCMATGDGTTNHPIARRWNGSAWSNVPMPLKGTRLNTIGGVSCVSSSFCVAVGNYDYNNNGNDYRTLIDSWNGANWTIKTSPNQGARPSDLTSVSCVTAKWCRAIGSSYVTPGGGAYRSLIESWNGSSWSLVIGPGTNTGNSQRLSISCVSLRNCMVVGAQESGGLGRTLAEKLVGTSWSIVATPNVGLYPNELDADSCLTPLQCVAVGFYDVGADQRTLAEGSS